MTTRKNTWATPIALALAVLFVVVAYAIPHWSQIFAPSSAHADTTDDLLKAIASKDSDGDGLPDWEEALYGTDPHKVDTFGYGMTDAQAVAKGLIVPKALSSATSTPATGTADVTAASSSLDAFVPGTAPASGSLTEQFAQLFFTQYLTAHENGQTMSSDDVSAFVTSAIQQLQQSQPQQDTFTYAQVKLSGSGPDAMRAYAVAAEQAFAKNTVTLPKGELAYLNDAINNNDTSAVDNITKISKAYTAIANAFMQLPVPTELAPQHLALANAFAQLGIVTGQFAAVDRDPILTSLGLANYTGDVTAMRNGFVGVASALTTGGVILKPTDPGYSMESITPANGY